MNKKISRHILVIKNTLISISSMKIIDIKMQRSDLNICTSLTFKVVLIAYTLILSLGLLVEARTNIKSILEEKVSLSEMIGTV